MADGDQTFVITSDTRAAVRRREQDSIWEIVATATFDSDDTTAVELSIPINGVLTEEVLDLPATTTTSTTTQLLIKDNGDNTVFDSGEQDENDTYFFSAIRYLSGTIDISLEPSAAYGSSETLTVTLRGV